ncbi:MAG TPA: NACHT domain-containing protein, partial [Nostocaceae cyanobacterium]|nr:NACHT domain-containing protein [Nostocaceae cyanobacterium]
MDLNIRRWLIDRYTAIDQIKEFSPGQMAGIAFRIIQDMEVQGGVPFEICTLAEVLEVSLVAVWKEIPILAELTEYLLRGLSQKKALKRNEGTWLAFQIAYLQALDQVLAQEANLNRPWLDRAMIPTPASTVNEETGRLSLKEAQLQGLLKNLQPGKLTDTQAQQALSLVADSLLVQQMNNATAVWLVANGAEEPEAKLLTQRLVNSLPGHLLTVIANNAPPLAQLQKFVRLGNLLPASSPAAEEVLGVASSTVGDKIDLNREYYRASFLQSFSIPLFMESFGLKDIYVPLTGLPIEDNESEQGENLPKPVDLTAWAQQQLSSRETIAVIESEPGYGKSSFCQVWAAQLARELYPNWMPILIRLRDIRYGSTFLATLKSALPENLHPNVTNWLEQDYPRCLLLLDGLDELPPVGQTTQDKRIFIQQLLKFHAEGRHKILLTSGLQTLSEVAPELIAKTKRITIQPLDVDELRQWFQQWANVQSLPIAQNFFTFLKQAGLFASQPKLPKLSTLIRQPLMLYLFGVLHRDGLLDEELLQLATNNDKTSTTALLWEVYCRLSRWLLGYPHFDGMKTMLLRAGTAHINRTPEAIANLLAGRHPQDVLAQMQSIALKILHSDRQQINLPQGIDTPTLPHFYFLTQPQPTTNNDQPTVKIQFSHSQLGAYFCAQAIISQLQALTKSQRDAYGKISFTLDHPH